MDNEKFTDMIKRGVIVTPEEPSLLGESRLKISDFNTIAAWSMISGFLGFVFGAVITAII